MALSNAESTLRGGSLPAAMMIRVSTLRRKAGLKVLFASGYARNAIVHHGRLDPGVELIMKPFTYADLA
jgi:hypothetical protein